MATFSPSPAPRRSTRLRQKPSDPAQKSSRLSQKTIARFSPPDERLPTTLMDVDETESITTERSTTRGAYGETTYAKSDELTVLFYASLPVEVKQVLRSAGMSFSRKKIGVSSYSISSRFLQRPICWYCRHHYWICACSFDSNMFCLATCSSSFTKSCLCIDVLTKQFTGDPWHSDVLYIFLSTRRYGRKSSSPCIHSAWSFPGARTHPRFVVGPDSVLGKH